MDADAHFDEMQHKRDRQQAVIDTAVEAGERAAEQAHSDWLYNNRKGIAALYDNWHEEVVDAFEDASGLTHNMIDDLPTNTPVQELRDAAAAETERREHKGDQT